MPKNIDIEDIPAGATINMRQMKDTMWWNHTPPLSTSPYINSYSYKGKKVCWHDGKHKLLSNFKINYLGKEA